MTATPVEPSALVRRVIAAGGEPSVATWICLDRDQRDAIREEVRVAAGDVGDINLALGDASEDRAFVVERLALLHRLVMVLDAIGWEEEDGAGERRVRVDRELASWAVEQAAALTQSLRECGVEPEDPDLDGDLDALASLQQIARGA